MNKVKIVIEEQSYPDDILAIRRGLGAFNVRRVPELKDYLSADLDVIKRAENHQIIGGVLGEVSWGWLYIDTLWVDEALRGGGHGRMLLMVIEQEAYRRGARGSYLFTTSFQALPFYQKYGYEIFGQVQDRPPGHTFYYLRKPKIDPVRMRLTEDYAIQDPPDPNDHHFVEQQLIAHSREHVAIDYHRLNVLLRDENNQVLGGMVGGTYWQWYDMLFFWIDNSLRGQGYGKLMLETAEHEILRRGAIGIALDTADFQAHSFYRHQGFEIVGTLNNRPTGHVSYFMKKRLV